jgi:osmotically-inducible protein OsmY
MAPCGAGLSREGSSLTTLQLKDRAMRQSQRFQQLSLAGIMLAAIATCATSVTAQSQDLARAVRKELRSLPNYGVFDLLTFEVTPDNGVLLGGYVVSPTLKHDAEKEVAKVKGVARVENAIEAAPVSVTDDDLRRKLFVAIYRDPLLARYGTAADEMAANRPRRSLWGDAFRGYEEFGGTRWTQGPFFGREPVGNYAIHILVNRGVVTLAGEVDSGTDKRTAGQKASLVFGVSTVNNDLHVTTTR